MLIDKYDIKHKTWAEIDLSRLRSNYKSIRRGVDGSADVMCVVKADAYGHGAERCAVALYEAGARWFAVSCLEEAMQIHAAFESRLYYGTKILILGYTPPENAGILARYDIRQTVFSLQYANALSRAAEEQGCAVRVHFKLDTGMNRLGFDAYDDAVENIIDSSKLIGITPEGIFTHFACADEDDDAKTRHQYELFEQVEAELSLRGLRLLRHVCNSAAIMKYPEYHLDLVRAGLILYGLAPYAVNVSEFGLAPVMTFKSMISHIHTVRAGDRVSYGGIYTAPRDVTAATVPVGYADGFLRHFADAGVYINGCHAPIIGRICMDQCVVDCTDIPSVNIGDEVVIFGGDPSRLQRLARAAQTINYELVCLIGKRVSRIYGE